MPTKSITTPASIRKKALYKPGRRIYSQTQGNKPGLQEEISLLPLSIMEVLRSFIKPGLASAAALHLGGGVSFTGNTISTQAEWIIKRDAIYYIEPVTVTVHTNARWGFVEIKLLDEEGEPTGLDFWDSSLDRAAFKNANTKILNKVLIQENYSATAAFPEASEGYSKWINYKKDTAGSLGKLQSAEHLPAQDFSIHSFGSLSQVPKGIITAKVSRKSDGNPIIQAGTYEVSGSAVDLSQPISVLSEEHNYGSGELRASAWYIILLSPSGQARIHLYAEVNQSLTKNIPIMEIEKVRDKTSRFYVPNSFDLASIAGALSSGVFLHVTGSAHPSNTGVFEVESLNNTDDAGKAGFKEIIIKNTHISRETEEPNINITAEAFRAFPDGAINNPPLTFSVQKNGYYSNLLTSYRIIGTFYTDDMGNISHVYSLASGREWLGGLGKNIGTVYPVFTDREPTWGLIADGAEVKISEYPELYAEIGDKFGTASASMFKLPDVRGRFLRFMDLEARVDPDAARRRRPDGATGDLAGSLQDHALQGHRHEETGNGHTHSARSSTAGSGNNSAFEESSHFSANRAWLSRNKVSLGNPVRWFSGVVNVSTETRPSNIALLPVIKF